MESTTERSQVRKMNVALLPPPGFLSHLIAFIELAKKLVSLHGCTVTLIIPHYIKLKRSLVEGIPAAIKPVFLPPVSTDDLPLHAEAEELLLPYLVMRSLPALRDTLSRIPAAALVVDLFAFSAIDVARELGIPFYLFYVAAANVLSFVMDLPPRTMNSAMKLPGSIDLPPEDFPVSLKSDVGQLIDDTVKKYLSADGILINSVHELELEAFRYLECRTSLPPVYPVGPLIRADEDNHESDRVSQDCLKWLDDQPFQTVLFVSFGSEGTLSAEQIRELAFGLEMSEQRFLWVVRSPQDDVAAAYLEGAGDESNPLEFLPEGFLERTRGRGLVVPFWAPQLRVLSHGSTGGFLTHCGWNSILESVVQGTPLIAWPLCFDQKINAVFVSDGLKCAIRVRENETGIVEREKISHAVKQLMGEEGKQIRNKMIQLKMAAQNALTGDGSSTRALAHVVQIWGTGK